MAENVKVVKMHELLATERRLKGQTETVRLDTMNTFQKKEDHFRGMTKSVLPVGENAVAEITAQTDIQTTINNEVEFFSKIFAKSVDASFGVCLGNTLAKASIVLDDGIVLFDNVPATALLEMEKRFASVMDFIKAMKTLDPVKGFKPDPEKGEHIYVARTVTKDKTAKDEQWVTVVPPTKEHPARVEKVVKDTVVGKITEMEWSSLITPAKKADLLERCEEVLRAIIRAKSRANEQEIEVAKTEIAAPLLKHIFRPLDEEPKVASA